MASLGLALTNKHYTWGAPHASIFHQSTTTIINEKTSYIWLVVWNIVYFPQWLG
jgi:hypothetical protein